MYKVNTWFANQIAKLAGFFGDKSIIYEMKASEADVIEAANRFGFCYLIVAVTLFLQGQNIANSPTHDCRPLFGGVFLCLFTTYHFRAIINTDAESVKIDKLTKRC